MNEDLEKLHDINISTEYTRSHATRYIAEIRHLGLETYRILKDTDKWILDNKINAQFIKWDDQWAKTVYRKNTLQTKKQIKLLLKNEQKRRKKN